MKNKLVGVLALAFLSALTPQLSTLRAQGTAFTYQGRLNDGANAANGSYDLTFAIYDALALGTQQGGLLTNSAIAVSNGLFAATIDFGNQFPGTNRWLEIGVRTNGNGAFTTLSPRQPVTPAPYAITAGNLAGTVPAAGLSGNYSGAVTFSNAASSFSGGGTGLTGLNASQLTSGAVPNAALSNAWKTAGNAGTTAGTQFLGTTDNQPLEIRVNGSRALRLEPNTAGAPNVIGGSSSNFVAAGTVGAVIAGGGATNYFDGFFVEVYINSVAESFGTVSGGRNNSVQVGARDSAIGGGAGNTVQTNAYNSTIGGGVANVIQQTAANSTIGGGEENVVGQTASGSTVAGGSANTASGPSDTVSGGSGNTVSDLYSTIGGGYYNSIQIGAANSSISGGYLNTIQIGASSSTIGGGYVNTIHTNASNSTIGGGSGNVIQNIAMGSTVAGGVNNIIQANATYTTIGGGIGNNASGQGSFVGGGNANNAAGGYSMVGGGQSDTASGPNATVGGGGGNTASGAAATIGGGFGNTATNNYATVGGGRQNIANAAEASVAGGYGNTASGPGSFVGGGGFDGISSGGNTASGPAATVGGGQNNTAINYWTTISGGDDNTASGNYATVAGGGNNTANGDLATVGGGQLNTASSTFSTVPGGLQNTASGNTSFAAGQNARAIHDRSFIWSSYGSAAPTFGADTFFVSALNGIGINCGTQRGDGGGQYWINLGLITATDVIETSMGAHLTIGGVWSNASDKNRKTDFVPVSSADILKKLSVLSVRQWRYTNELSGIKHIGPTAQDFKSAFGLGTDDKSIGTVDEEGVALAAIQGLNQKVEAKDAEIQNLQRQNDSLAQRLNELESTVKSLAKAK